MSSTKHNKEKKYDFKKKINYLSDIRHEIKKNRIIFDEGKENFGLDEFKQLMKVKNTSEVKGYPFRGYFDKYEKTLRGIKMGLKIIPIETKYEKQEHPSNIECIVLKELTESLINKGKSPHIAYYLGIQKISNRCRAVKSLNLKRLELEDKIKNYSNMIISEFVTGGSLDNWIFNTYENDNTISDEQWKCIVFQLIYTIAIIQNDYHMLHNDFHYGNILIDTSIKPGGYFVYEILGKRYYLPNTGIIPKIWDFEFCMVYKDNIPHYYPNKYITGSWDYDKKNHVIIVKESDLNNEDEKHNVPYEFNEVYDLHYFLTSLLDLYISQELFDWVISLYPNELIPEEESSTTDSSTDTDSTTYPDSTTDSTTDSNTDSTTDSTTDITNSIEIELTESTETITEDTEGYTKSFNTEFLQDGRLKNGVEKNFILPTPKELLQSEFFKQFLKKPEDFDEQNAVYFNSGVSK